METITLSLPGGQILGKDEAIVRVDKFTSSLSTFYIKSEFCLTNKRFVAHYPNIVLGILPMGSANVTLSLRQISRVQIDVQYKMFRMLVGLLV
jgi:hypothetical protein